MTKSVFLWTYLILSSVFSFADTLKSRKQSHIPTGRKEIALMIQKDLLSDISTMSSEKENAVRVIEQTNASLVSLNSTQSEAGQAFTKAVKKVSNSKAKKLRHQKWEEEEAEVLEHEGKEVERHLKGSNNTFVEKQEQLDTNTIPLWRNEPQNKPIPVDLLVESHSDRMQWEIDHLLQRQHAAYQEKQGLTLGKVVAQVGINLREKKHADEHEQEGRDLEKVTTEVRNVEAKANKGSKEGQREKSKRKKVKPRFEETLEVEENFFDVQQLKHKNKGQLSRQTKQIQSKDTGDALQFQADKNEDPPKANKLDSVEAIFIDIEEEIENRADHDELPEARGVSVEKEEKTENGPDKLLEDLLETRQNLVEVEEKTKKMNKNKQSKHKDKNKSNKNKSNKNKNNKNKNNNKNNRKKSDNKNKNGRKGSDEGVEVAVADLSKLVKEETAQVAAQVQEVVGTAQENKPQERIPQATSGPTELIRKDAASTVEALDEGVKPTSNALDGISAAAVRASESKSSSGMACKTESLACPCCIDGGCREENECAKLPATIFLVIAGTLAATMCILGLTMQFKACHDCLRGCRRSCKGEEGEEAEERQNNDAKNGENTKILTSQEKDSMEEDSSNPRSPIFSDDEDW